MAPSEPTSRQQTPRRVRTGGRVQQKLQAKASIDAAHVLDRRRHEPLLAPSDSLPQYRLDRYEYGAVAGRRNEIVNQTAQGRLHGKQASRQAVQHRGPSIRKSPNSFAPAPLGPPRNQTKKTASKTHGRSLHRQAKWRRATHLGARRDDLCKSLHLPGPSTIACRIPSVGANTRCDAMRCDAFAPIRSGRP
uniref:Uncharacterized protein n=1 Tax=Ustilaginoidea virens TaxID=1159556 RepID=A0A1X9WE77_USTVR|nr:hypothetical protein [Ustilaginoidea virens]